MLEAVLRHLRNWFCIGTRHGAYAVEGGTLAVPWLKDGQWFRVVGSAFNDGLHRYPDCNMSDEEFVGEVWALAIPDEVVGLAARIEAWERDNAQALDSPYQSESFGGYSYTKASAASGQSGAAGAYGWRQRFRSELNAWRKL